MSDFHKLSILEIIRETPSAVSIVFNVPDSLKDTFQFEAGQYITLRQTLDGQEVRRAYSLCNMPESGILKVGVKEVSNGTFSVYANNKLKANDMLDVMPPEGKFIFEPNEVNSNNYAAFVAGSGITPVLSIVKTALEHEPRSTFILVYGNQSIAETIYHTELENLKKEYPNRFFLEFIFSRKQEENALFGRIDRSITNFFIKNKYKKTPIDSFYLCGPESMINEVTATLEDSGIGKSNIHFELFSSTEEVTLKENHKGNTQIMVTVDDVTESFIMSQNDSILDAVLAEGLDAPHSCQGGICSTCIARITEGKAEMRKNQILTDEEIAEGLVLTCQALPSTPIIKVDYDDV